MLIDRGRSRSNHCAALGRVKPPPGTKMPWTWNKRFEELIKMTMLTKAMKIRMGTAAAVLAAALTSCVSNEVAQPVPEDIPITYSVLQKSMGTRAAVTVTTYPTGIPFGSFAYYLPSGKTWRDDKKDAHIYIDNDKVTYDEQGTNSFAANSWHSEMVHYWPKTGTLTFFSYSPYDALQGNISCTPENGLMINSWTAGREPGDAEGTGTGVDLMIAQSVNQTGNTSSVGGYQAGVPTAFQHICCQVEVQAKLSAAEEDNKDKKTYTVNSVSFNNLWTKANYSSNVGTWSGHSDLEHPSYTINGTEGQTLDLNGSPSTVFPSMIVIPQNLLEASGSSAREAPSISIDYTPKGGDRSTVKKPLANGHNDIWRPGKKYVITIIFSVDEAYIEFKTSVNGWGTDVNPDDITIGN